jgi:putative ferrous iron transport protein C
MILSDIKQYLSERGNATLTDISVYFDTDQDAMRGMLEQWIRKGRIRKLSTSTSCSGGCNRCDANNTEIYQWVDADNNTFKGIRIRPEHH